MIKIIKGTFGYQNGNIIEPKTKDSEPFELNPQREAELVDMGIAEYVGEAAAPVTEADSEAAEGEDDNGFEVTLEYLESLKLEELKEVAAQFGVSYKVGTKKADFVKEVWDAIDVVPEDEEASEEEDDGEEPPTFDAGEAVV